MSRRRIQIAAFSLVAFALAEVVLSTLAIGHSHANLDSQGPIASACSHGHDHGCHAGAEQTKRSEDSEHSQHDDCSICRHLAEVAVVLVWHCNVISEEMSEPAFSASSSDVTTPSYLLPRPRAPPTCG